MSNSFSRRRLMGASSAALAAFAFPVLNGQGASACTKRLTAPMSQVTLAEIAAEAYVFAYPLVLFDLTRQQLTAFPAPTPMGAPVNQFAHVPVFPDDTMHSVVSPNVDSLYSIAWLDLSSEPHILSLPDMGDRYYVMQMLDAWTNVIAAPGPRTTGSAEGHYGIFGPGGNTVLPEGVESIESPTNLVWILGRTQTNGVEDYNTVHALQASYRLTPLSAWGTDFTPPADVAVDPDVDRSTAPVDQIAGMTAQAFWTRFTDLLVQNPPAAADTPMMEQLARLDIHAGVPLEWDQLSSEMVQSLETGVVDGLSQVETAGKSPTVELRNTWAISYGLGRYGTDYLLRAATAWVGMGANLPEDAVYPVTRVDSTGAPLDGANRYVLHFTEETLPPVNGFWSLTMYDSRQFLVQNPLNRYAIGDRDDLVYGPDGSLDILLQHEMPGADLEANWLPAPEEEFSLMLRLYWPKTEVLDGSWLPPAVTKAG